tara:strand:+ start:69 stop:872 length:804 start_codon:yes stop_codon:yes gene_type:complete
MRLSKKEIYSSISKKDIRESLEIIILESIDSTNNETKKNLTDKLNKKEFIAILAEKQTSGRGRGKNKWVSPKGKNIYLSLGFNSTLKLIELEALSLSVAVVISKKLNELTNKKIYIKWPNDLFIEEKKVGGILIESISQKNKTIKVVIGIGINISMSKTEGEEIDQQWESLEAYLIKDINRNNILGSILETLIKLINNYEIRGFSFYKRDFENLNILHLKKCIASTDKYKVTGIVKGVTNKGELIFETNENTRLLKYGEVTLRKSEE